MAAGLQRPFFQPLPEPGEKPPPNTEKGRGSGEDTQILISSLPLTGFMTLTKLFNFSKFQFPHLQK